MVHIKCNGKVYLEEQQEKPFATLELSQEAAQQLLEVCYRIGVYAGKDYMEPIFIALNDLGLQPSEKEFGVIRIDY